MSRGDRYRKDRRPKKSSTVSNILYIVFGLMAAMAGVHLSRKEPKGPVTLTFLLGLLCTSFVGTIVTLVVTSLLSSKRPTKRGDADEYDEGEDEPPTALP